MTATDAMAVKLAAELSGSKIMVRHDAAKSALEAALSASPPSEREKELEAWKLEASDKLVEVGKAIVAVSDENDYLHAQLAERVTQALRAKERDWEHGHLIVEARAQLAQMRETLKFYAKNWKTYCGDHGVPIGDEPNERLLNDQGLQAKAALTAFVEGIKREAREEAAKVADDLALDYMGAAEEHAHDPDEWEKAAATCQEVATSIRNPGGE